MARIMKNEEQEAALKQVNDLLDCAKTLNLMLSSGSFNISLQSDKKVSVPLYPEFEKRIITALGLQKAKIVKEINELTAKYRISLDDSDWIYLQ